MERGSLISAYTSKIEVSTFELPQSINAKESTFNLKVEGHGKSLCDSHFSVVEKYLKSESYRSLVKTTQGICEVLESEKKNSNEIRINQSLSTLDILLMTPPPP